MLSHKLINWATLKIVYFFYLSAKGNMKNYALAGVAQWIECWPVKGLPVRFPVRAHVWVLGQVPGGGARGRQTHSDVSLPLFLCPFPSV